MEICLVLWWAVWRCGVCKKPIVLERVWSDAQQERMLWQLCCLLVSTQKSCRGKKALSASIRKTAASFTISAIIKSDDRKSKICIAVESHFQAFVWLHLCMGSVIWKWRPLTTTLQTSTLSHYYRNMIIGKHFVFTSTFAHHLIYLNSCYCGYMVTTMILKVAFFLPRGNLFASVYQDQRWASICVTSEKSVCDSTTTRKKEQM